MSLYIKWINLIKERSSASWLTHSQKTIYDSILTKWQNAPFVNLYGPTGSGKTFIAWQLVKEMNYFYCSNIDEISDNTDQIILDGIQYSRALRTSARSKSLGRIIMITQIKINEAMPNIDLELDEKDIIEFKRNLADFCEILFLNSIPEGNDLGLMLRNEIVARGDSNDH